MAQQTPLDGAPRQKRDKTHWLYIAVIAAVVAGIVVGLVFPEFGVTIVAAVLISNFLANEGESTWFEGVQLLALYAVLGLVFFFA